MDEILHRLSEMFQALGNGVRLQILLRLQEGKANVTLLANYVNRSVKTVSHHMRVLRDNDLVESHTKGRKRFYWLKRPKLVRAVFALKEFLERFED